MIVELVNSSDFDDIIKEHNKVIVDFSATWCGPCKMLAPMLEKIAQKYPDWTIVKIDIDQCRDLAGKFKIQAVPTLLFIVNNKLVDSAMGYMPDSQIEKIINKF